MIPRGVPLCSSATQPPRLPPVLHHMVQCVVCIFNHFFTDTANYRSRSFVNFIICCYNLHSISYFPKAVFSLCTFLLPHGYRAGFESSPGFGRFFTGSPLPFPLSHFHLFHVLEALQILTPHFQSIFLESPPIFPSRTEPLYTVSHSSTGGPLPQSSTSRGQWRLSDFNRLSSACGDTGCPVCQSHQTDSPFILHA